jgi:mannosyltransferase
LLTINPFHVFFSQEARPYTLLMFWALLAIYCFVRLTNRITRAWLIGLTIAHACLFIVNIFGLLIPFVQFVFMLTNLRRYRRLFRAWFAVNMIAVLPLGAWYFYSYLVRGSIRSSAAWMPITTLPDLVLTFQNFLLGNMEGIQIVALLIFFGVIVWSLRNRVHPSQRFLLLWLTPLPLVWVAGLRRPIYGDRYLIVVFPALLLLLGYAFHSLQGRLGILIRSGLIVIMLVGVLQVYISPLYRKDQWREASTWIFEHGQEHDAIVASMRPIIVATAFYYSGKIRIQAARNDAETPQPLNLNGIDRVWLVIGYVELSSHALGEPYFLTGTIDQRRWLGQELPASFHFVESKVFNGVTVVLYQRGES